MTYIYIFIFIYLPIPEVPKISIISISFPKDHLPHSTGFSPPKMQQFLVPLGSSMEVANLMGDGGEAVIPIWLFP